MPSQKISHPAAYSVNRTSPPPLGSKQQPTTLSSPVASNVSEIGSKGSSCCASNASHMARQKASVVCQSSWPSHT
jgi:hypothetical protein